MEYNKRRFQKTSDKKLLHKVKKQWVVISSALLLAIGGSALHTITTHADTTNNQSNRQHVANQLNSKMNSVPKKPATNSSVNQQASLLHQRIIANQINSKNYIHNLNSEFKNSNQTRSNLNDNKNSVEDKSSNQITKNDNLKSNLANHILSRQQTNSLSATTLRNSSNQVHSVTPATGRWGSAYWELTRNGNLNIHDGTISNKHGYETYNPYGLWIGDSAGGIAYPGNVSGLNVPDVYSITTNNVAVSDDISDLFAGINNLESVDVSGLHPTGKYFTSFHNTFSHDPNLTTIKGLSVLGDGGIDQGSVQDWDGMFYTDPALKKIDLSQFSPKSGAWQDGMIRDDPKLEDVNLSGKFSAPNVADFLSDDPSIRHIITNNNVVFPTSGNNISHYYGYNLDNNVNGKWQPQDLTFLFDGHAHPGNWIITTNSNATLNRWGSAYTIQDPDGDLYIFHGQITNNQGDANGVNWNNVKHIYTNGVTAPSYLYQAFRHLPSLQTFDGSGMDMRNASNISGIFISDFNLQSLKGLSSWHFTNKLKDISGAFQSDFALTNLDGLSDWNVSSVDNSLYGFVDTFWDDKNLVDASAIKNWNMSNSTKTDNMFKYDNNLEIISVGHNHQIHLNNADIQDNNNWENQYRQSISNINANNLPEGKYYDKAKCALATFNYIDWRTGAEVSSQNDVPVAKDNNISEDTVQSLMPKNYSLANSGDNNDPTTGSKDYLPSLHIGNVPQSYTIPVIPNDVFHYGYWGHAHYEFTYNGTLYLFNGNMDTATPPQLFQTVKTNDKGAFYESNFRPFTYADDVVNVKTSNVVAPADAQGLFAGSNFYDDPPLHSGAVGEFNFIKNIDLSGMNTSHTHNMAAMFHGDNQLLHINFGNNFDTSDVSDMSSMFNSCDLLKNLNLSSFDTRNCNDFNKMFYGTGSISDLDLHNFNIKPSANVMLMFALKAWTGHCDLKEIVFGPHTNIQGTDFQWNGGPYHSALSDGNNGLTGPWINSVTGHQMSDIKDLAHNQNVGSWIAKSDVKTYTLNFVNQLTGSDVGNHSVYINGFNHASFLPIDPSILPSGYKIVPNYGTTIPLASNQTNVTVPVFNPRNMVTYGVWGSANYYLKNNGELDLTNGDMQINSAPQDLKNHANQVNKIATYSVRAPSNSSDVFSGNYNGFHNLTNFDFSHGFDTSSTTNMNGMFSNLSVKDLNLNDLKTSDTSTMDNMFANDNNLQTLAIDNFAMGEHGVTNTQNMFNNDNKIESLAIGNSTIFQPNSALNNGNYWIDDEGNQYHLLDGTPHNAGIYYNYNPNDKNDFHTISINYEFGNQTVAYHNDVFLNPTNTINKLDVPNINNYALDPDDPNQFAVNSPLGNDHYPYVNVPVDKTGMWGQAQWLLNARGRFLLQNGDLDTNAWQGPTGSDMNHIKSIITNNVTAPNKMSDIFRGLPNVTKIDISGIHGLNNVTDFINMMSYNPKLQNIEGLNDFTTAPNANLQHLFDLDTSLSSINLAGMNTSNVTDMSHMFESDYALQHISNLNTLDTNNVSDISWMFCNDWKLIDLNPSSLITNHIHKMISLFYSDKALQSLDLSNADTSNVQNMNNALRLVSKQNNTLYNSNLNTIKIGNKTKLYNAGNQGNPALPNKYWSNNGNTWTDLNNDTNPVAGTYQLTKRHFRIKFILDSDNDTNYSGKPFVGSIDNISSINPPKLNTIKAPNGYHIYNNAGVTNGTNYSDEYQQQVNQMNNNVNGTLIVPVLPNNTYYCGMWGNTYYTITGSLSNAAVVNSQSDLTLTISSRDLINPKNSNSNPNNHEDMRTNNWLGNSLDRDGSNSLPNAVNKGQINHIKFNGHVNLPSDSSNLFNGMDRLSSIDFTNANAPANGITNTNSMLSNDGNLQNVDLKDIDFSKDTSMANMFSGDSKLSDVILSNYQNNRHMNNLSDIGAMFSYDSDLKNIKNLSDLDVSNVNDMSLAFERDSKLSDLDLSSWKLSPYIGNTGEMFSDDTNLKSLNIANFDLNHIFNQEYGPVAESDMFSDDFTKPLPSGQYYKIIMNKNTTLNNDSGLTGDWIAPQYKNNPPYSTPRRLDQDGANLGPDSVTTWYEVNQSTVNFINQNNANVGQGIIWHNVDGSLGASPIPRGYFEDGNQFASDIKNNKTYNIYVTGEKANLHVIFKDNGNLISDYNLNGTNSIGDTTQLGRIPLGYTVINPNQLTYEFKPSNIINPSSNTPASNDYRTTNTMKDNIINVKGNLANVRVNYINSSDGETLYSYQENGQIGQSTNLNPLPYQYAKNYAYDNNMLNYQFNAKNISSQYQENGQNKNTMIPVNIYVHRSSNRQARLRVAYINQNGRIVGYPQMILGRDNDVINNIANSNDGGISIPNGYQLDNNDSNDLKQTLHKVSGNNIPTIYLHVHGIEEHNVKVIINRIVNQNGHLNNQPTDTYVNGINGNSVELKANDYKPANCSDDDTKANVQSVMISNHNVLPAEISFYYNSNEKLGAPIMIRFINQNGTLVGNPIYEHGNINSQTNLSNDINNHLPINYHNPQITNNLVTFTNSPQQITIPVTGVPVSRNFKIRQIEENADGTTSIINQNLSLNGVVGDKFEINPYYYVDNHNNSHKLVPPNYHSSSHNQSVTVSIKSDEGLTPFDNIDYIYHANYQKASVDTIRVHYITDESVGSTKSNGAPTDNSEIDEVSDHNSDNASFNINPYLEDIPTDTEGNNYDLANPDDILSNVISGDTSQFGTNNDVHDIYIHVQQTSNNNTIILS